MSKWENEEKRARENGPMSKWEDEEKGTWEFGNISKREHKKIRKRGYVRNMRKWEQ